MYVHRKLSKRFDSHSKQKPQNRSLDEGEIQLTTLCSNILLAHAWISILVFRATVP